MGKRYGRNQRRRARERIADLELAHAMTEGLLRHVARQRDEARAELNDVAEALGPHFVGLRPKEIALRLDVERGTFRMATPSNGAVTMHPLEMTSYQSLADSPDAAMHVRVTLASGIAAYALSEKSIHDTPATFLAGRIAAEIAPFLLNEIRRK